MADGARAAGPTMSPFANSAPPREGFSSGTLTARSRAVRNGRFVSPGAPAGRGASAKAVAPPTIKERRLNARCSGVARRSEISQPWRRITFIALILVESLSKPLGPHVLTGKSRFREKEPAFAEDLFRQHQTKYEAPVQKDAQIAN